MGCSMRLMGLDEGVAVRLEVESAISSNVKASNELGVAMGPSLHATA